MFYDPLSYAAYDHPYEVYRQLRDHAPVYYNARRDLWVVSRYEDVSACLRNHEQMVNALGNDMDGTHASYGAGQPRRPGPAAPHRAAQRGASVVRGAGDPGDGGTTSGGHARELLAALRERGGGDFAADVALPLVFGVSMRLLGAPASDSRVLAGAPAALDGAHRGSVRHPRGRRPLQRARPRSTSPRSCAAAAAEIAGGRSGRHPGRDHPDPARRGRERHGERPRGGRAGPPDAVGVHRRARRAAHQLRRGAGQVPRAAGLPARATPTLVKDFVEETLRYDGPAKNLCRQTTAEITIAGVTIPADSRVMVLMGSANRDERVYPEPDAFDLFREFGPENKILTFGEGIHSCMGAPIARLTAQVAVEELVAGLDGHRGAGRRHPAAVGQADGARLRLPARPVRRPGQEPGVRHRSGARRRTSRRSSTAAPG